MKTLFISSLFLYFINNALASSSIKIKKPTPSKITGSKNAPSSDNRPVDPDYKIFQADPRPKKEAELKSLIFSIPRKGMTINNLEYSPASFSIFGTFKKRSHLDNFLEELKKYLKTDKEPQVKVFTTSFAGAQTHNYKITSDNSF